MTPRTEPRPLTDASVDVAARMLRELLAQPMTSRDRIDALALLCSGAFALRRERPRLWSRLTLAEDRT